MSNMLVSEIFRFQTFEKLSPHPARGISHIETDGQCGERKMTANAVGIFYTYTYTETKANFPSILLGKVPLT